MYEQFYGLQERPFDLIPDPRFLFLSPGHREALGNLEYGLTGRKGITLLVGDAGLGKTTLIRALLRSQAERQTRLVYLSNPTLTRAEFIRTLASGFGLSPEAMSNKAVFLEELERTLHERHAAAALTALIIDEAQSLPHELLEEIRLLANIETESAKLLPVILAGQQELAERLNEPSLRQLKQRVALRCELKPFTLQASAAYIAARIRVAGGEPRELFTQQAISVLHDASNGIPRTISVLCDNALVSGFALGQRPVTKATVFEVCRDFDIQMRAVEQSAQPSSDPVPASESASGDESASGGRPAAEVVAAAVPAATPPAPSEKPMDMFGSFNRRQRFSFF